VSNNDTPKYGEVDISTSTNVKDLLSTTVEWEDGFRGLTRISVNVYTGQPMISVDSGMTNVSIHLVPQAVSALRKAFEIADDALSVERGDAVLASLVDLAPVDAVKLAEAVERGRAA
jgi:hypothetical protein